MANAKISIRRLARELEVSHSSLSKAYRRGTLTRGVRLDAAGRLEVVDADAAREEWGHFHAPRRCAPPPMSRLPPRGGDATGIARLAAPEPPTDRFPGLSRQDLIDRWQAEGTIALVILSDSMSEAAEAADRAARLDRIIAAIATLAAELDDPTIASEALDALRGHLVGLDLDESEVEALTDRVDAARRSPPTE